MLAKLSYIFTVLFSGIFFSVLFYSPAAKIQVFLENKLSICNRYNKIARVLSVLFCYLCIIGLIILIISIFYYNIYNYFCCISWDEFSDKMITMAKSALNWIPFFNHPDLKNRCMDLCFSAMEVGVQKLMKSFASMLLKLPKLLAKLGLGIIIAIYLLIDRDSYLGSIRKIKKNYLTRQENRKLHAIVDESRELFFGYWKGQSLDALVMGISISLGLYFIGVPLGIAIGILAGIGNLIPYIGPIIAYTFTIFFCILEGKWKTLLIALIYLLIIQQVDGSYIGPKLIGKHVDLRPLTVVVSVLIGGTLFGALGMMLAVPFAGILKSLIVLLRKEQAS